MENQNSVPETPPQIYIAPHLDNPPPPKRPFMFSKILLPIVIIFVLLAATAGTYLALNSRPKQTSKITPTPLPTEASAKAGTPAPIDETANWKTYINTNGGFQISYPGDMSVKVEKPEPPFLPVAEINEVISFTSNSSLLSLGFENAVNINTKEIVDPKIYAESVQKRVAAPSEISQMTIAGRDGYKLQFIMKPDETNPFHVEIKLFQIYLFGKNSKSLLIIVGTMETEQDKQIMNQILSTFKFLDENGVSPSPTKGAVFCTQDAKLCPDGSYVGRVAPNCEFSPCPSN